MNERSKPFGVLKITDGSQVSLYGLKVPRFKWVKPSFIIINVRLLLIGRNETLIDIASPFGNVKGSWSRPKVLLSSWMVSVGKRFL